MADHAGHREMRACQRVSGRIVFGDIKTCRHKPENVVTTFAAAAVRAVCKLPEMRIFVAVGAIRKPHFTSGFSATDMAFRAGHILVQTLQRKTCQTMIKTAAVDLLPAAGLVACFAIRTQGAVVRICMTG